MTSKRLVAVASEDDRGLSGEVSMHFGRCPFFTLVQVEGDQVVGARTLENPYFQAHQPGVVPQLIHTLGANVILAGGMGPRAIQMFHSFGIDVATGAVGRVDKVVAAYLKGTLSGIIPCEHSDHDHGDEHHHHHEPN